MSRLLAALLLTALVAGSDVLAQTHTVTGYVRDADTRETLIGATVAVPGTTTGTATNHYGFYSLTLPEGPVQLAYSYVGYETQLHALTLAGDTTLIVHLAPDAVQLDDVTVEATREEPVEESTRMGTVAVPVRDIERLPALLGEVDVLKALQLLPGVQSGTEGTSGLYVRGGGPDQNLILLDGVPVYNASHLFGFFSVFNADAINRVELTKGGFPARYGGRLSSVVDITMREGHMREHRAQGALGLISSRLTVEGPIVEDRTSYIVSGRRTYLDLVARPFLPEEEGRPIAYFYDLNAKVNHVISSRDRLYASVYTGADNFGAEYTDSGTTYEGASRSETSSGRVGWGNVTAALRWNHLFSPRLFANTTLTYSRFHFGLRLEDILSETHPDTSWTSTARARYDSSIRDWSLRTDVDYVPSPQHYVRFGAGTTRHRFRPAAITARATDIDLDTTLATPSLVSYEAVAYAEDDVRVTERLKINAGLHASAFFVEGQAYASLQPRLAARYLVGDHWALKASGVTMRQYLHLLSSAGIGLPTDLWVPSTESVPPQRAWQVAAGLSGTVGGGGYQVELEGYYKQMRDLITYRQGAAFAEPGSDWQEQVYTGGTGTAYGGELFVQRKRGRTTGWIGYTLAWSDRRFDELNDGRTYPYRYDRRHDLSLVLTHRRSERLDLSLAWVYGTGQAVTLPHATYRGHSYDEYPFNYLWGETLNYYGARNDFRMPAYHRLDVAAHYYFRRGPRENVLTLSIYNAYNRRNPFFMEVRDDWDYQRGRLADRELVGYALFPIIPALSYRFSF